MIASIVKRLDWTRLCLLGAVVLLVSACSAVAAGASCVLKITRMVGIAKIRRITANAMVHEISSAVWPCTCLGMGAPGRSRKRQHA